MSGRSRLTDEQLDELAAMREAGMSYLKISAHFGISDSAARYQCLRLGADRPDGHLIPVSRMPAVSLRGGIVLRRFTTQEDATVQDMRAKGRTLADIAHQLQRSRSSVVNRILTLAMLQDRRERREHDPGNPPLERSST